MELSGKRPSGLEEQVWGTGSIKSCEFYSEWG